MAEHNQQFASKEEWVNRGLSWLTRHPMWGDYFKAICFDARGRYVGNGGDFRRAEEDGAFPVRWLWPDQVGPMALLNAELLEALKAALPYVEAAELEHDTATGRAIASRKASSIRAVIAKAEAQA